jgi:hypothetical protein
MVAVLVVKLYCGLYKCAPPPLTFASWISTCILNTATRNGLIMKGFLATATKTNSESYVV